MIEYVSTRNPSIKVRSSKAILDGQAEGGGLYVPSDLDLVKVDEYNRHMKLDGATFTLRQLDPEAEGSIGTRTLAGGRMETKVTGADGAPLGHLVFEDLEPGYYEVTETMAPGGYILKGDSSFYFKVTPAEMTLLEKEESLPMKYWSNAESPETLFENGTLTVTNTPGSELPSTGGIGTGLYCILGLVMMLGAGGALIIRKRKKMRR
ncbi:MAG: LPXTG cell wall anchor domain-containing protein [Clostridia bacterium]|nr:LPXTG cell wall anchor domain-containing protein [Clostridia bacterium]